MAYISQPFLEADKHTRFQLFLLALLGLFVPPLPIYLMTGPNRTVKTFEFGVSCVLTLFLWAVAPVYTFVFVVFVFPRATSEREEESTLRVGDIESQVGCPQETTHQSGDIQHPSLGQSNTSKNVSQPDISAKDTSADGGVNEPLLPTYEESEGNSRGDVANDMTKFGDNKVQH